MLRAALLATVVLPLSALPAYADPEPQSQNANTGQEIIITAPVSRSETDVLAGTSVVSGEELVRDLKPTIGETLAQPAGRVGNLVRPQRVAPDPRAASSGERVRVLSDGIGSHRRVEHLGRSRRDHQSAARRPHRSAARTSALLFGSSAERRRRQRDRQPHPRSRPKARSSATGNRDLWFAPRTSAAWRAPAMCAVGEHLILHADGNLDQDRRSPHRRLCPDAARPRGSIGEPRRGRCCPTTPILPRPPHFRARCQTPRAKPGPPARGDDSSPAPAASAFRTAIMTASMACRSAIRSIAVGAGAGSAAARHRQDRFDLRGEVDTGRRVPQADPPARGRRELPPFRARGRPARSAPPSTTRGSRAELELIQEANRRRGKARAACRSRRATSSVVGDEAVPAAQRDRASWAVHAAVSSISARSRPRRAALRDHRSRRTDRCRQPALLRAPPASTPSRPRSARPMACRATGGSGSTCRAARAPSAEELFANGPHAGTQAFELGNPDFATEELGARGDAHGHGRAGIDAGAYYDWFRTSSTTAQVAQLYRTKPRRAGGRIGRPAVLPEPAGRRALLWLRNRCLGEGARSSAASPSTSTGSPTIVHAADRRRGPAPRIPAAAPARRDRAQGAARPVASKSSMCSTRDRLAVSETPTTGHRHGSMPRSGSPRSRATRTSFTLSANNIFDVDARLHAIYLKDFAPLARLDISTCAGAVSSCRSALARILQSTPDLFRA